MGQDTRSIFQYLKDTGYNFLIGGFHVKGQVIDAKGVSAWGYGGQTVERGDWIDGKPSDKPADQQTRGRNRPSYASTNCRERLITIRSLICRIEPLTGWITSLQHASCCSWTSQTLTL